MLGRGTFPSSPTPRLIHSQVPPLSNSQCNASIITGTTTVKQVEECINAFKLELPKVGSLRSLRAARDSHASDYPATSGGG